MEIAKLRPNQFPQSMTLLDFFDGLLAWIEALDDQWDGASSLFVAECYVNALPAEQVWLLRPGGIYELDALLCARIKSELA